MKIILIPDHISNETVIEEEVFKDNYNLVSFGLESSHKIPDSILGECSAVLVWHHFDIKRDVIEKLKNCKVIVRIGVGFDNVDVKIANGRNITVCNVPDYGTNDVADHTIGLILALARGIDHLNNEVKKCNNWDWNFASKLNRLTESTIGLIGLGRIGTATALRAKAFGMKVIFYDPYVPNGKDKSLMVKESKSLDDLLNKSDIVSIHTPLTKETKSLVNKNFLSQMKSSSILINTARGKIFELDDLYDALKSNRIKAVGTDVLPIEPPDTNHPLIRDWKNNKKWLSGRFLITPHSAFCNKESLQEMRMKAAMEAKRLLEGFEPINEVKQS